MKNVVLIVLSVILLVGCPKTEPLKPDLPRADQFQSKIDRALPDLFKPEGGAIAPAVSPIALEVPKAVLGRRYRGQGYTKQRLPTCPVFLETP